MRTGLLVLAVLAILGAGCAARHKRSQDRRRSYVDTHQVNDPESILGSGILKSVNGQEVVRTLVPCPGDYGTSGTLLLPSGITIGNAKVVHVIFRDGRIVGLRK